ncbi:MAG: GAF domain-containing protein, partial [Bryobacteraceae bacterium]
MSTAPGHSQPSFPDLGECELEPIHIPGAIEPHGGLLVLSEPDLVIVQVSTNTLPLLGIATEKLLGMSLGNVLAEEDVHRLTSGHFREGQRRYVAGLRVRNQDTIFEALVHRHQGLTILELEPSFSSTDTFAASEIASFTDAMAELTDNSLRLPELCQRIAARIRHLTGFHRVMVYRFLKDDSGSVLAEDRREDLIPYLGLRYPASDIPVQARRLYLLNTLRIKPDVHAPRAALLPEVNPITGRTLDMTFCMLRAMSPYHDEYLRNMGVTASMSISIVKDGRLWGLIACHHGDPKFVPHPMRTTCEVLALVFSSHIAAAEEEDKRAHATAVRAWINDIAARFRNVDDVAGTLAEEKTQVLTAMMATG